MTLEPLSNRKSYRRQFRLPIDDAQEVERQIDLMKNNGIIEASDSIDYNSPVFLVNKKSGAKRIVVDLRGINNLLRPQIVALPRISEIIDEITLQKSQYLTTTDLFSGFWQIRIQKGSRKYTSFTAPLSEHRWQYCKTPFGLLNSPAALLTVLNQVFAGRGQRSRFYVYYLILGKPGMTTC